MARLVAEPMLMVYGMNWNLSPGGADLLGYPMPINTHSMVIFISL
jgi:hypothetical protein